MTTGTATDAPKTKKTKKVGKHERCTICHYPFGTGTCDSCRDPRCDMCGIRLLSIERERGAKCSNCSPETAKYVEKVSKAVSKANAALPPEQRRRVALVLTD